MINSSFPNTMKKLIQQTVNAECPSDFILGKVTSEKPLLIRLDDKRELDEDFLILSDNVRDFEVDIEVKHVTENRSGGSGYAEFASHNHEYKGRKKIIIYNGLKVGEQVALIRQKGGQLFYVANRVFDHSDVHGQWV